jgi:hypothetical protein
MAGADYQKTGINRFAAIVSGIALVVGEAIAFRHAEVAGGSRGAWTAVPVALAIVAYAVISRFKGEREVPTTARTYPVHAERITEASIGELVAALRARGYRPVARCEAGGELSPAAGLGNAALRLRDERLAPSVGEVVIQLRAQQRGALLGVVESIDAEAGFYDEMAQFALVALAGLWPELYVAAPNAERAPAAELARSLPATPYGLALL